MGKVPFHLRPIEFEGLKAAQTEPISLTRDLAGKVTLSSKHVAVSLKEVFDYIKKKNTDELVKQRGQEEVILQTDTILELVRASDAADSTDQTWAIPMLAGFAIGALAVIIVDLSVPVSLYIPILIAGVLGVGAGFYARIFYNKNKKKIQEFIRQLVDLDDEK